MYMYALKVHVPQSLALCADHDILFLISTFISCERICDRSLTDNIKAVKKFSERCEDRVTSFDCLVVISLDHNRTKLLFYERRSEYFYV